MAGRTTARAALLAIAILVASPPAARASAPRSIYDYGAADAFVTAGAAAGVGFAYAFPDLFITPRCPCDPGEVNAFDRRAIGNTDVVADTISDVTVGLAIGAPPLVEWLSHGAFASGRAIGEDIGVFAEVLAVNGALVTITKHAVQRPLPRTYMTGPDAEGLHVAPRGYRSFYSGHASTTFAALSTVATTLNLRHGFSAWPWAGAVAIGSSVAIERVLAGRHFPTDVIVGAVIGTAIGIATPLLHRRADPPAPGATPAPGAPLAAWRIAF